MNYLRLIIPLFLLCAGCQKYSVIVHEQKVTPAYLPSFNVGSPDPRLADAPNGKMLIAEWWLPSAALALKPKLVLTMLFKDFSEQVIEFPICSRIGYETFDLFNKEMKKTGGFLSYKAEIITEDGEVFRSWQHQLWVKLIDPEIE